MCQKSWSTHNNISTTIHAMTKLFVPFCSAQDGESTDMNCLMFWAHCKIGKILTKQQVYIIRAFSPISGIFEQYEILISLECAVDSERNDVIIFVISCSVAEIFLCKNHKNPAFNSLTVTHKYLNNRPYMLQQNRLYCSVQLKMASLLIWIV